MTAPEQLFWGEVQNPKATRRSIAVCYALLIALQASRYAADEPRDEEFWPKINAATHAKLGIVLPQDFRKVDSFRAMAWDIHAAATRVREIPASAA